MVKGTGETKSKIIKLLIKNNELSYTEIKNNFKISDVGISKHLKELVLDGVIIRTENKKYSLSTDKLNSKLYPLLKSSRYDDYVYQTLYESEFTDFNKFINHIQNKIMAQLFFTVIDSIKIGERMNVVSCDDIINTITEYVTLMIVDNTKKELDYADTVFSKMKSNVYDDDFLKEFKKLVYENPKYKKNFRKLHDIMIERYKEELKILDS